MRFKINRASLIVGNKFTVFALFYFVFEGNFQVQVPPRGGGAYIWRGDLTRGFLHYEFRALILGGAHFPGFYGIFLTSRPRENSIIAGRVTRKNKSFEHIKTIS